MKSANPRSAEELARKLAMVLQIFAYTQEDRLEENAGWAMASSPDWTWDEAEQAMKHRMKGT